MSCRICGRGACSESFHTMEQIERQDRIDNGECADCIDKQEEMDVMQAEYDEAKSKYLTENKRFREAVSNFFTWFNRHYPNPSSHPDHEWCKLGDLLNELEEEV